MCKRSLFDGLVRLTSKTGLAHSQSAFGITNIAVSVLSSTVADKYGKSKESNVST